jgi:hypothetical protein
MRERELSPDRDQPSGRSVDQLAAHDVLEGLGRGPQGPGGFDPPDDPAELVEARPAGRFSE